MKQFIRTVFVALLFQGLCFEDFQSGNRAKMLIQGEKLGLEDGAAAKARRRRFSVQYKKKILEEADACKGSLSNMLFTATGCTRCEITKQFMDEQGRPYQEVGIKAGGVC